jgi:hypothetical protein
LSRAIPFLLVIAIGGGCAPKDREVRLARVAAETRNLEVTFDRLEERLLADQARVRHWRELRERHESVSAVACASQEEHAQGMAVHAMLPERAPLHRQKVAAVAPTMKQAVRSDASR